MANSKKIFLLLATAVISLCQLQLNSPQTLNLYVPTQGTQYYYDTGSYQIFTSSNGFSIVNEANNQVYTSSNPLCTGTATSQLFCVDSANKAQLNQVDLSTGQGSVFMTFNSSIYSIKTSYGSLIVYFTSNMSNFSVVVPPSNSPVCSFELNQTILGAVYSDGAVTVSPAGPCAGPCNFTTLFCNGSDSQVTTLNFTAKVLYDYYLELMVFTNGGVSQVVGFPSFSAGSTMGDGYVLLNNQSYNSGLGLYNNVQQINQTNILIQNLNNSLTQYYFNVSTGSFTQVGSTISIPSLLNMLTSPISIANQNAVLISTTQGISNFYLNLNSMTTTSWVYQSVPQAFSNGTIITFIENGYFLANMGQILYQVDFMQNSVPAHFNPYKISSSYPNTIYGLYIPLSEGPQLYSLALSGNSQPTLSTINDATISSNDIMTSINPSGSSYVISVYQGSTGNVTFFNLATGYNFSTYADVPGTGPMVFFDASSNIATIYTSSFTLSINIQNGNVVSNTSFSQQFQTMNKLTETFFFAYTLSETSTTLNVSLVNGLTKSLVQSFIVPNTQATQSYDVSVSATVSSSGNLQALFITTLNTASPQNWVIYPDNSNYSVNASTLCNPGPGNTAVFCTNNLGGYMLNCTSYSITDLFNPGNPSQGGDLGTVIGIVALVLVLLVAGFLIRRRRILKRNQEKNNDINTALKNV